MTKYNPEDIKLKPKLIYNAIRCPDGTILESTYQWDYNQYMQEDGRAYSIDGGTDYQRITATDDEYVNLAVYSTDSIERIREVFKWTSQLDEDGNILDCPITRKLKDLEDSHVEALVEWTKEGYAEWVHDIMKREVEWRQANV